MVKIISTLVRSLTDSGSSRRISINETWIDILGFNNEEEIETAILYTEKHGFFFGAWKKDEQPDAEDISDEKLQQVADKVEVLDAK